MNRLLFLLYFVLIILAIACEKDKDPIQVEEIVPENHPVLLLAAGEEKLIRDKIEKDPIWEKLHFAILKKCNDFLGQEPVERKLIGRRLLDKSRECLKRVFYLSYAYRMTEDDRFFERAKKEMLAAARFSDWNPSHFLDVAEMTMALAIGYDWLYDKLDENTRLTLREAIVSKGLTPSWDHDYNWFLRSSNNWNQVCNAGMTFGALAVYDQYPELAKETIDRAIESIPLSMQEYQPNGAYPEGYGYWNYGTSFNVLFLSAIEKAFDSDYGLTTAPGFMETAGFLEHMTGPSSLCFNWGDCGLYGSLSPAMFWFAEKNNDPSLLWVEKGYLERSDFSKYTGNRILPAIMVWAKDIPISSISEPASTVWMGQGANPGYLIRTSWTNPNAMFVGFKAGSPSVNHGHMDIGSFVMESDGVRWASDLGVQSYNSLESKGIKVFGKTQDAQRWTILRMNNYFHNTLTIDGELQRVDGFAKIDRHADEPDFSYAISDISTVYDGQLMAAKRGVGMVDQQYVIIRDEVATLSKPTLLEWRMLTTANVEINDGMILLKKDGRRLHMLPMGSVPFELKTWSTEPTTDYDAPNPGTIMVGFEAQLPADSDAFFQMVMVSEKIASSISVMEKPLDSW